jgi:RHS repeat-associated protein
VLLLTRDPLTDVTGSAQALFGFTDEPADPNGLLYLRARFYPLAIGTFGSRDPLETGKRASCVHVDSLMWNVLIHVLLCWKGCIS